MKDLQTFLTAIPCGITQNIEVSELSEEGGDRHEK
jgi:hypothetical protein